MQRERSSQHRGILLKSLFLMPGWCSNTLHTYRAVVSTASRLHKFCITQFIAHFPSVTLFRGTEQQVSWSFKSQVFSQTTSSWLQCWCWWCDSAGKDLLLERLHQASLGRSGRKPHCRLPATNWWRSVGKWIHFLALPPSLSCLGDCPKVHLFDA